MSLAPGPEDGICTARGCRNQAQWVVTWTNPATRHSKRWLACLEHKNQFLEYFGYRDFPTQVTALTATDDTSAHSHNVDTNE